MPQEQYEVEDNDCDWDERDMRILGFNTQEFLDGEYQSLLFEIRTHEFPSDEDKTNNELKKN